MSSVNGAHKENWSKMAWEIHREPERYTSRYHDRRELVSRESSFKKENVLTVSKIAATVAIAKALFSLFVNNTPTLPWESLFLHFLSRELDLLILPIAPKMGYAWLQSIPIFSQSEWLAQWWAETYERQLEGRRFCWDFWEKTNKTFSLSFLEGLLCGCNVWIGLQSWGVERWISGSEEPKDKAKTWKAKQGHRKKPGSWWIISGTGLSLT